MEFSLGGDGKQVSYVKWCGGTSPPEGGGGAGDKCSPPRDEINTRTGDLQYG